MSKDKFTQEQEDLAQQGKNIGYFPLHEKLYSYFEPTAEPKTLQEENKIRKSASMQTENLERLGALIEQRRTFAQHYLRVDNVEERLELDMSIQQLNEEIKLLLAI